MIIKKQPNGRYAVWSSEADAFIAFNATLRRLCEYQRRMRGDEGINNVQFEKNLAAVVETGKGSFDRYGWEDCLRLMREQGKRKEAKEAERIGTAPVEPDPDDWDAEHLRQYPEDVPEAARCGNRLAILVELLSAACVEGGDTVRCVAIAERMIADADGRNIVLDAFPEPTPWRELIGMGEDTKSWKQLVAEDEARAKAED